MVGPALKQFGGFQVLKTDLRLWGVPLTRVAPIVLRMPNSPAATPWGNDHSAIEVF